MPGSNWRLKIENLACVPLHQWTLRTADGLRTRTMSSLKDWRLYRFVYRSMAEGGGIEPLGITLPWFSRPVATQLAAPSVRGEARARSSSDASSLLGPDPNPVG